MNYSTVKLSSGEVKSPALGVQGEVMGAPICLTSISPIYPSSKTTTEQSPPLPPKKNLKIKAIFKNQLKIQLIQ